MIVSVFSAEFSLQTDFTTDFDIHEIQIEQ